MCSITSDLQKGCKMIKIPASLWFRFLLELTGLVFGGLWGYRLDNGPPRYFFTLGIPLIMAIVWGVFNVPDDPGRTGMAPVPVSGRLRILIETGVFSFAVFAAWGTAGKWAALAYIVLILLHVWLLRDRFRWLYRKN